MDEAQQNKILWEFWDAYQRWRGDEFGSSYQYQRLEQTSDKVKEAYKKLGRKPSLFFFIPKSNGLHRNKRGNYYASLGSDGVLRVRRKREAHSRKRRYRRHNWFKQNN